MEPAPFNAKTAEAPTGARAVWVRTSDDVWLRLGHLGTGDRGTVLLFPGRTEYLEKYGQAAAEFAAVGLGTFAIDWRGQGLSDRLLDDPLVGHVARFTDYQKDVAAMYEAAEALALPRPYYLLGHSMGGAIGLRALIDGFDVVAAMFSGPMWGLKLHPALRALAWTLPAAAEALGLGHKMAPTTGRVPYPLSADPDDNLLTHDPAMLGYMRRQLEADPGLALGGPSLTWLREALLECDTLQRITDPHVPTLTLVGSEESIASLPDIRRLSETWPRADFLMIDGAAHEVMMESPPFRRIAYDRMIAFIAA